MIRIIFKNLPLSQKISIIISAIITLVLAFWLLSIGFIFALSLFALLFIFSLVKNIFMKKSGSSKYREDRKIIEINPEDRK